MVFKNSKTILFFFAIFLCLTYTTIASKNLLANNPQVWLIDSMERIEPNDSPGKSTEIELYGARGEYESFQLGIKLPEHNKIESENIPIALNISDLKSSDGKVISRTNITPYKEHYIYVDNPSPRKFGNRNPSLGKGWYPDALIPLINKESTAEKQAKDFDLIPIEIKNNINQPLWFDIFIPRDTISDRYSGTITIIGDREPITRKIELNVWDFELPLTPSLKSAFLLWNNKSKQDLIELLKHKIMPVTRIQPQEQPELIKEWGLSSLRLPFWSGANVTNCSMETAPSPEEIISAAEKNQPELLQYVYSVDEIDRCPNLYQAIQQWGKNIHQAGYQHLAVMSPVSELYDYVDIWVIDPKRYHKNPQKIAETLARGQEVWFYTALTLDKYSPKWQLDFAPINYRIPHGFINQSLGMTGVLYWAVDYWQNNPWENLDYPHKDKNFPGEGQLVYSGKQIGVSGIVPSMRLKWVREGVEDYEYIEILKKLDRADWALEKSRTVGSDWQNWTRDTQKLAATRIELGNKIHQLSQHK